MTAAPQSPLVEKVARALAKAAFPSRKWQQLADYEKAVYLADAKVSLEACHAEEMLAVIRSFQATYDFGDYLWPEHPVSKARALLAKLPPNPPASSA